MDDLRALSEPLPSDVNLTTIFRQVAVSVVPVTQVSRRDQDTLKEPETDDTPQSPVQKKHINGVRLPVEQDRKHQRNGKKSIVAIDFGTTSCSVAYCYEGDPTVRLLRLSADDVRVPTAILMDADGTVVDFGKNARFKYAHLPPEKRKYHHFFSDIKMILQHDKEVSWTNTVESKPTHEFFVVEVIAMILKYLKDRLLDLGELSRGLTGVMEASDFHWIITVPAMWKARGKQMMREAAYMAGIASEDDEISSLSLVTKEGRHFTSIPSKPHPELSKPEALSLALEPEVAALYCINQAKALNSPIATSSCYMVLDIGGGTVDITAHKVTDGCIQVVLPPKGNDWGGRRVNEEFREFLEMLVDDKNFTKYLFTGKPDVTAKNKADLESIVYNVFEEQKQFFGNNGICDDEALINLPYSFMKTYSEDLRRGIETLNSPGVRLSENELIIPDHKMAEFFSKAISEITSCVSECVRDVEVKYKLESVFFVGGFGGCKYLHDKVREVLRGDIQTFCPRDHNTAVVRGAVLFGQNPAIIKSRVADATYGTSCLSSFNSRLHDRRYLVYNDDRQEKCNHLFVPFVFKGDVIHADKVLVTTSTPFKHFQKNMYFEIFITQDQLLKYVKTPKGKSIPEATKVGELTVKMPDMRNDKNREVKLTFDFSHTEIHIEAYDITSGERVTTIVDFLSDFGI